MANIHCKTICRFRLKLIPSALLWPANRWLLGFELSFGWLREITIIFPKSWGCLIMGKDAVPEVRMHQRRCDALQ